MDLFQSPFLFLADFAHTYLSPDIRLVPYNSEYFDVASLTILFTCSRAADTILLTHRTTGSFAARTPRLWPTLGLVGDV
jgi:hypothetical protein